jgi:hypothetical protein
MCAPGAADAAEVRYSIRAFVWVCGLYAGVCVGGVSSLQRAGAAGSQHLTALQPCAVQVPAMTAIGAWLWQLLAAQVGECAMAMHVRGALVSKL